MYFIFANSIEEAFSKKVSVRLEDDLDNFIQVIKEHVDVLCKDCTEVLLGIDPYGDKILSVEEIKKLLILGQNLLDNELIEHLRYEKLFIRYDIDEKDYMKFAKDMIEVCNESLREGKTLISLGD